MSEKCIQHRYRHAWIAIAVMFAAGSALSPSVVLADPIEQKLTSGPIEVAISLTPESPVIGDTLTLAIDVVAEKDVEVLMPEFGTALDRFSIVDFAPRESIDDQGRTVAKQTYRLDPPSSGDHVIPPILIEYVDRRDGQKLAPDGLDAFEVLTDRIPFSVRSVLSGDGPSDLKPPMGALDPLPSPTTSRWGWWLALAVVAIAAIPFLLKLFFSARRRRRRRSAYDVAKSRLQIILQTPRHDQNQIGRFYVGLSLIIRQYIEDRFDMRAPDLTTEEFLTTIGESPDFSGDHQTLLRDFLKQADLVKFARAEPSDDETNRAIEKAERFLDETSDESLSGNDESSNRESDSDLSGQEVVYGKH